jgi:hypothetical protein
MHVRLPVKEGCEQILNKITKDNAAPVFQGAASLDSAENSEKRATIRLLPIRP